MFIKMCFSIKYLFSYNYKSLKVKDCFENKKYDSIIKECYFPL